MSDDHATHEHSTSKTDQGFTPTAEQQAVVSFARKNVDLGIEALAGTGKTSTLRLFALESGSERGQYLAFNRAIVAEANASFPEKVNCSTAHGLAMRAVGHRYRHRLDYPRMKNHEVAEWLECEPISIQSKEQRITFSPDQVARYSLAMIKKFTSSLESELDAIHAPLPSTMKGNTSLQMEFGEQLLPYADTMWTDICNPDGELRYDHDYYLKLWQLSDPHIDADYILFDEAQDADPVMLAVVNDQQHAQLVYCGDDYQTLYEWRGAKNALDLANYDEKLWLTQSFRFGTDIAGVANIFLERLSAPKLIQGYERARSSLGTLSNPDAILTRTNSALVQALLSADERGKKVAVVGGIRELESFATACEMLQQGKRTTHPELAPFVSWADVQTWVEENPEQSPEIARLIKLVDRFGPQAIKSLVKRIVDEKYADVTLSTVHQAKGREWATVQLASDFAHPDEMEDDELRVAYVAVTRAKGTLDVGSLFSKEDAQAQPPVNAGRRPLKQRPPIGSSTSGNQKGRQVRVIGRDPGTGRTLELRTGRYGHYVSDGISNASVPDSADPEKIDVQRAAALLTAKRRAASVPRKGHLRSIRRR